MSLMHGHQTYNQHFEMQLTEDNIMDAFAGLRVLPSSSKSAFNKSRESLIIHNHECPAQITLIGGKLTAYRASSEEVLRHIKKIIGDTNKTKHRSTKNIPL